MNRKLIALILFLPVAGTYTRSFAQPVDTVWILPCIYNELYAEGIESPSRVWLRASEKLYDSVRMLQSAPQMARLEEIGRTIAPYPLPDFANAMVLIASIPQSCRAPLYTVSLECHYAIDYDRDVNHALFDTALHLARTVRNMLLWPPGNLYAVRNSDDETLSSPFAFLLVREIRGEARCREDPRVARIDFELMKRKYLRDSLMEALQDEAVEHWDSVLVVFYNTRSCTDTTTFEWVSKPSVDEIEVDGFDFGVIVPRVPDTVETEPKKSPEQKRDSISITAILRSASDLSGPDLKVDRLYPYFSNAFREPYLARQDALLREAGFAKGCERRILQSFIDNAHSEWDFSFGRFALDLFEYRAECLPENPDFTWMIHAKTMLEFLSREWAGIPERFYIIRKDGELRMVIGFPQDEEYGKPLVLYGEELRRTLDAMPEEHRIELLREIRYEMCGIEPFLVLVRD